MVNLKLDLNKIVLYIEKTKTITIKLLFLFYGKGILETQ